MKVIKEQNKVLSNIWGKAQIKAAEYRLIKYVIIKPVEDGFLLYHLVSGEMIFTDSTFKDDYESLIKGDTIAYKASLNLLIEKRYIVPANYDEMKSVRQLRTIMHRITNHQDGINSYTIMPTSYCNARCFYCFEADFPHVHMTEETADQLIQYMIQHCGEKKFLNLTWFGGEPTVNSKIIHRICQGLKDNDIEYSSFMYSNGFLFDEEMVRKAVELWELNKIQITLDGTEEVYNKAKNYYVVSVNPYYKVLESIKKLLDAGVFVLIRLNMDYYNYDDLKELISELAIQFSGYSKFQVYVSILFEDEGFEKVTHSLSEKLDLEDKKNELEAFIIQNFPKNTETLMSLPFLKSISCCADNDSHYLINPKGDIAVCDHETYDHCIGSIYTGEINQKLYQEMKKGYEGDECKRCKLYPTCYKLNLCITSDSCNEIKIQRSIKMIEDSIIKYYNDTKIIK